MENNSSKLTIIRDDPLLLTAIWSNVAIWFWRTKLDSELLELLEKDVVIVRERMKTNYGALTLLFGEKREPPSDEARKQFSEILKHSTSNLLAKATVLESEGFTATVSRGAITSIEVEANRRDAPHHVFSRVREAAGWLAQSLGHDQNWARELHKLVTEQRERIRRESDLD